MFCALRCSSTSTTRKTMRVAATRRMVTTTTTTTTKQPLPPPKQHPASSSQHLLLLCTTPTRIKQTIPPHPPHIAVAGASMLALLLATAAMSSHSPTQDQHDDSTWTTTASTFIAAAAATHTNCDSPSSSSSPPSSSSSSTTQHRPFNVRDVYDIQEILGEGAFGKVFHAIRKKDGKSVALKVMPTEYSSSIDFQREIYALEELSNPGHDHVCYMYNQHLDNEDNTTGYCFLALEFIPGGELFEHLITSGPFSEQDAAKFLQQFSQALVYIHSKGFDLKPENLMMGNGKLKVVDFGCASKKPTTTSPGEDEDGRFFGTTAYLPPETLANRQDASPTEAVDCFAAGVIMYIVLTGSHPFDPTGEATEEEIEETILKCGQSQEYLHRFVFDDARTEHLSPSSISLLKALLQPNPMHRMTSKEFEAHPWIQGEAASGDVLPDSDLRLKRFWQKRFRAAIVRKYGLVVGSTTMITDDQNLREIFRSMDVDGNGTVDRNELKLALADIVAEEYMEDILQSLDSDGDGTIDFEEFKTAMKMNMDLQNQDAVLRDHVTVRLREMMKSSKHVSSKELIRIFNSLKSPESRTIRISTLLKFMEGLGLKEDEIVAWADGADRDKNGEIDFEEFSKVMMEGIKK